MSELPRVIDGLPVSEFGFPGQLRDKLVAAVLRGEKTATASLRAEYAPEGEDELPRAGSRMAAWAGWRPRPHAIRAR